MSSAICEQVNRISTMIFEEVGFIFADPDLSPEQKKAPLASLVQVHFDGPLKGTLVMKIYGNLLPSLAANMLGEDEIPSPELQEDACKELANEICGNLLPAIGGSERVFCLGAPQVVEEKEWAQMFASVEPLASVELGLDQGRAQVMLYLFEGKEAFLQP